MMSRYAVAEGRIVKGWSVTLAPSPEQVARFRRDDGARRFACNWAIGEMRKAFDGDGADGCGDPDIWSHYALRKRWNRVKGDLAPWWAECSKEAYSNGIADAVTGLKNWQASKTGKREGRRMRFPRFRRKGRDPVRCTYTTGALRVEDSRHIVLPGVGRVETAENIRSVWRHLRGGTARLLSATIREGNGAWRVSLRLEIVAPRQPEPRSDTVGADGGIGDHLLVVMRADGTLVRRVPNRRALRRAEDDLRQAHRALSRKTKGSRRWNTAKSRLGRAYARVAAIRADSLHKVTSELAKTHGRIVIEDLRPSAHLHGARVRRRSWADAAMGELRRQLGYKCDWYGSRGAERQ